jgi:hypothetical protein
MKAPAIFLILMLSLLSGCGPSPTHYWYYPDKTLEQAKEDYRECEARAEEEMADSDAPAADGYTRSKSLHDDWAFYNEHKKHPGLQATYKQSIIDGCMRSKGYLKVNDYRLPTDARRKDYETVGVAGR